MRCALAVVVLAVGLVAGCSHSSKSAAELDANELLALFQQRQHAGSKDLIEADLGRFRVTHSLEGDGQLHVQFHLIGVIPQERKERLAQVLPPFEKRVRDAVISLVQRTESEHLTDASLAFFKEEVASTINRVLQERLLVDVVFSDFSTDREAGTQWSATTETKPSGGGHGGGHGH